MSRAPLLAALAVALLGAPDAAGAQEMRVAGEVRDSAAALLRDIARGPFLLLARDTTLPPHFRHRGDVVVRGAEVRLEGQIQGRVAVIGGTLFVRPRGVVSGPVAVADGFFLPSAMATVGPVLRMAPEVGVAVSGAPRALEVTLTPPPGPPRLRPAGLFGLVLPTYDRVDGLTVRAGGGLRLGADPRGARARGEVHYHVGREALGGLVGVDVPLGDGGLWAVAEAGRVTATNEGWIRGDLVNSLAALLAGSDIRDYWSSDYATARLERRRTQPLIQGEGFVGPFAGVRVSRGRSLPSLDPWSLTGGDGWRENRPVFEGTIASAVAGAELAWRGRTTRADAELFLEWAPRAWSDTTFAQAVLEARTDVAALYGHTLSLRAHLMGTLGDGGAPPQRWSHLGGPGTLPTLPDAEFAGDQLVYLHSAYGVPLPVVTLPLLGMPTLALQHAVGMAWRSVADAPGLAQNLGVGVRFRLLSADVWIDPALGWRDPVFGVGAELPM